MMNTNTDEEACVSGQPGKSLRWKKGKSGCEIYTADGRLTIPSFDVEEVDPTGCGDAFCAGFLSGMIFGWPLEQVGRFANAAGALQATKVGPMEGAADLEEVREFMEKSGQQWVKESGGKRHDYRRALSSGLLPKSVQMKTYDQANGLLQTQRYPVVESLIN